jgi:hypothetical protein
MIMVYSSTTLEDTFTNLTDSVYMSKSLKSQCTVGGQPGEPYCLFNNKAQGKVIKVDTAEMTIQLCFEDFPPNHTSNVTFYLEKLPGHGKFKNVTVN